MSGETILMIFCTISLVGMACVAVDAVINRTE
jgi:hypothetical protein